MADIPVPRRNFLVAAGLLGSLGMRGAAGHAAPQADPAPTGGDAGPRPGASAAAAVPAAGNDVPVALKPTEWAFFEAVADLMIPADELTPGGADLGIPLFIDRQLGGAYGSGSRLYRSGPFVRGKPEQGYQLSLTPREYFGAGVAAVNALAVATHGKEFDRVQVAEQDRMLKDLESGKASLGTLSGRDFVAALVAIVMEGFFSDPIYGGNRGKASWAMIGFPGLPALYADKVATWQERAYVVPPQSISDQW